MNTTTDEEANSLYREFSIVESGRKVGSMTVLTDITEGKADMALIERIDIEENERNKGYGTKAINVAHELAYNVFCAPDNEDAKRLYDRIGTEARNMVDWIEYADQGYGVYEV
jgi:RimJ/RimL family protein N-acetyltransferase